MNFSSLSFPTLVDTLADVWQWPRPPFAWRHEAPGLDAEPPCQVETRNGATVHGVLLGFDVAAGRLRLRPAGGQAEASLAFSQLLRLTLTTPLAPAAQRADVPVERVPAAAQEREYRLVMDEAARTPLAGRTAGYVEADEGLYLFPPVEEERSVLRVFVPRSAYQRCDFGPSAEEIAARRWIVEPKALLEAIERQQRMPVLPIGQSLIDLGMITPHQLERALQQQPADVPLGEALVKAGIISRSDLQTALAHKMGYPLVDLARFPVEPAAAKKLSLRMALATRALPLMIDRQRLIVAMDRPSRAVKLRHLHAVAQMTVVPVLTSKTHLLLALTRLAQQDIWAEHAFRMPAFFATTTT